MDDASHRRSNPQPDPRQESELLGLGARNRRHGVAESLGEGGNHGRELADIDRRRCDANPVTPVTENDLSLVRMPRDAQGSALTSCIQHDEAVW